MILVGIGANLPAEGFTGPLSTCLAAIRSLEDRAGMRVLESSRWYRSAPVPISDQPWYVNAVLSVSTNLSPPDLMRALHEVEALFGRVRGVRNAARVLDLDLLDYDGRTSAPADWPILPHPRALERAFVLRPMLDLAPDWSLAGGAAALRARIESLSAEQILEVVGQSDLDQARREAKSAQFPV